MVEGQNYCWDLPGWEEPPHNLRLSTDEVHIWGANLDQADHIIRRLFEILNDDERARVRRYYFEKHKRHFIVARGLLRVLLGRYLHLAPTQLVFTYNRYGKPALQEMFGGQRPCFNLAHSRGLVYYALGEGRELGVDVEYLEPTIDLRALAKQFFAPSEASELFSLPAELQVSAFFNCWTRKEAYLKAIGEGLTRPLSDFAVSLTPEAPAKLLVTLEQTEGTGWNLRELPALPGYVAALAYEGPECSLSCWQWIS